MSPDKRRKKKKKNNLIAFHFVGVIERCEATTMMGLQKELDQAAEELRKADAAISLISGTELFLRFVTKSSDGTDGGFEETRQTLVRRANKFLDRAVVSRSAIGKILVDRILRDGLTILVHGLSRVVLEVLSQAAERGKRLNVYCSECRTPTDNWGEQMAERITAQTGFQVSLVVDSSISRIMNEVDVVLFGAEGIVENGGVINTVGTFQIAMVASLMRVPVYVAAESFKFVRHFPLSQNDVPQVQKVKIRDDLSKLEKKNDLISIVPFTHDYTPPEYLTLLFTDSGILTPAAVSDTLIRLYL
jgi:translation initiation factor eIF-2B subunit alpha